MINERKMKYIILFVNDICLRGLFHGDKIIFILFYFYFTILKGLIGSLCLFHLLITVTVKQVQNMNIYTK